MIPTDLDAMLSVSIIELFLLIFFTNFAAMHCNGNVEMSKGVTWSAGSCSLLAFGTLHECVQLMVAHVVAALHDDCGALDIWRAVFGVQLIARRGPGPPGRGRSAARLSSGLVLSAWLSLGGLKPLFTLTSPLAPSPPAPRRERDGVPPSSFLPFSSYSLLPSPTLYLSFLHSFFLFFFWVKCKNDIQQAGRDAAALVPMATLKPAFLAGFFTPPCVFFYSTGLGFRLQPCSKGPGTIPRGSH